MNKLLSAIFLTIISLVVTLTFTRAQYLEYRDYQAQSERYVKVLDQAKELSTLRDDLVAQLNSIPVTDRDRLEKVLPRSIDTVRLTIEVSAIADRSNVSISNFSFTESQTEVDPTLSRLDTPGVADSTDDSDNNGPNVNTFNNYSSVDMTVSINANYKDFKDFIGALEDNLRLTDIQSVAISQGEDARDYNIVLRTYWLGT